jgi:hypothetical protein
LHTCKTDVTFHRSSFSLQWEKLVFTYEFKKSGVNIHTPARANAAAGVGLKAKIRLTIQNVYNAADDENHRRQDSNNITESMASESGGSER